MASNSTETRRQDRRQAAGDQPRREQPRLSAEPAPVRGRPANENDPGTSMMLAKLRRSPSNAPYVVAFVLTLAWIAGWFFVYSAALSSGGALNRVETIKAIAVLVLPVAIIIAIAYFLWRASQLRMVSEVLMQSAMRLIKPQDVATEGLTTIAQAVRSEVDLLVGGIEHAIQRASSLEEIVHKEISAIERAFGGNEERIRSLVTGIENQREALHQAGININNDTYPMLTRLEANTKNLDGIIINTQDTLARLEGSLRDTASGLSRTIDDIAHRAGLASDEIGGQTTKMERIAVAMIDELRGFSHQLATQVDSLTHTSGALSAESLDFSRRANDTVAQVLSALEQQNADAAARITGSASQVQMAVHDAAALVDDRLEQISASVTDQFRLVGGNLNDLLVSTSGTIANHLKETAGIVSRQMQDSGVALAQRIEESGGQVTEKLISVSGSFSTNVGSIRDELLGQIEVSAADLYARLDQASSRMSGELEQTALRITDHINSTTGDVANKVAGITDRLTLHLDQSSNQLTTVLDNTSERLGGQLSQATTDLTAIFEANTKMMSEQLDKTATQMTNTFAETAVRVTRQVADVNTLMAQKLDKASSEVTAQLDSAGTSMFSKIDAVAQGLGQTTTQITGRLEQDTGLLVNRIDQAAKELETASTATATRLDEAHRKFSRHVETANTYLADQLSSAAGNLDERLESVSLQLTGKLELTGTRISERLDDVTSLVEKSVEHLNQEMERVLTNRKSLLDGLIGDAAKRASEIDAVMTSYMNLIEESLAASETRAKDIGRVVSEQAAQANQYLESEIRKLENASGDQIAQAARVLKDQHERAMEAMNEMLSSTASDFQQTAQDMRITAQQVVKDIDAARVELKRAILDLPEETRSNADAMRRVVADQISALNTLAEVVKRQTGGLDLSGPGVSLPRSYREPPPGKSEGAAAPAPKTGTASAQEEDTRRSEAKSETGTLREQILAKLTKSPAESKERLLPASTREMDAVVEKLHATARDIVESIDGDLPRDIERNFNSGKTDVYTHRLFEGRGKRLQRALAERYGKERLVKNRVDTYVRLFERLLDLISAAPRGASLVEACLASEAGRVYVMLAAISGRIPPQ